MPKTCTAPRFGKLISPIVVEEDRIVTGEVGGGQLFIINLSDGNSDVLEVDYCVKTNLLYYQGLMYLVNTSFDFIVCIDMKTLKKLWHRSFKITSRTIIINGRLIYGSGCSDWKSGKILWELDELSSCKAAIGRDVVVTKTQNSGDINETSADILVLDLFSGETKWQKFMGKGGYADDILISNKDSIIAFCRADPKIRCLDIETGKEKWTVDVESPIVRSPSVFPKHILYTDGSLLVSLEPNTGKKQWELKMPCDCCEDVLVQKDKVWVNCCERGNKHSIIRCYSLGIDLGSWTERGGGAGRGSYNIDMCSSDPCKICGGNAMCIPCDGKGHKKSLLRKIPCQACSGTGRCGNCLGTEVFVDMKH